MPAQVPAGLDPPTARHLTVHGTVQGVGFRPFVYRLARELELAGHVRNAAGQVEIAVAGPPPALDEFAVRLRRDAPPRASVTLVVQRPLNGSSAALERPFTILESVDAAVAERLFPPDIATCDACLRELFDPTDRRYRYPFINCTDCGPRATIIEALPYDRARTSMRAFPLCAACEGEYRDPADRRFHAEPVACPVCGPQLAYRPVGAPAATAEREAALAAAVSDLLAGRIVAVKGLGGYHLACDATDPAAVARLRDRKRRWAKPFAVMVRDLAAARRLAHVDATTEALLASPARPIVLLPRRARERPRLAAGIAPRGGPVGLFLPYTPLHHLLLEAVGRPIVLTSGNLVDEPLIIDDTEALERLGGLADAFLLHDRPIRARYDDSVTRAVRGRESVIRRGRGYAPQALELPVAAPEPILAVGAELKHTFVLARGERAHVAPHTGDLEDLAVHRAFEENLAHLERLLALEPSWVAHDLHPGYLSTQYAARLVPAARRIGVQHHHAHLASCLAEHGLRGPALGLAYDGLGMGEDGTFWGGELLVADLERFRRLGRFGRAAMPGGALAVKRPYRMALGYLFGSEGGAWLPGGLAEPFLARLDAREVAIVRQQVARGLNAPVASSAGRLFDAVSSLLGLRDVAEFEAQAAIDLELAAGRAGDTPAGGVGAAAAQALPYRLFRRDGLLVQDPVPTLTALLERQAAGEPAATLAAAFQDSLVELSREWLAEARRQTGLRMVCLSGGVFQNAWLAETLLRTLAGDGFEVFINERVPVNDGGVSYGQAAVAAARLAAG